MVFHNFFKDEVKTDLKDMLIDSIKIYAFSEDATVPNVADTIMPNPFNQGTITNVIEEIDKFIITVTLSLLESNGKVLQKVGLYDNFNNLINTQLLSNWTKTSNYEYRLQMTLNYEVL